MTVDCGRRTLSVAASFRHFYVPSQRRLTLENSRPMTAVLSHANAINLRQTGETTRARAE